ncbi:MAG: MurR/RpiR family transcriptional regulator [Lachnospiraceae bacterium]|nr:MurR/RpiR family transcriptional regulator [Lachnospiraceae bacterium]
MADSADVFGRIKEKLPEMSKSQKKLASYIKSEYEQAAFMTAAQIGAELSVSESTVVRFAAFLGYRGFPEFQKELENCVKGKLSSFRKIDEKYGRSSESEILNSVLNADIEKIRDTIENLNPDAFDMAVDSLLEAETVYIMGLRSNEPLASFLHFYLNMVRGNVVLVNTTSVTETFEQMLRISEKDCFVGISFPRYSMRTLKAMEFANDRNARVIAITDSMHSPMNLYSSCNLFARSDMVSIVDSLVAPLSVINALVVAICLKAPDAIRKDLEMLEEVWENYQVYLNDEINFIDDEPILNYSLRKADQDGKKGTEDVK